MDGIQIRDAAFEISEEDLGELAAKRSASLAVTKLDLSLSPEALNRLLKGTTPRGKPAPKAQVSQGRLQIATQQGTRKMGLDLQLGSLRVELSEAGIRLVSE
jgi:hypothetical protein